MIGVLHTASISTVKVIVSSDKLIKMLNFNRGNQMWKVNWSTWHKRGTFVIWHLHGYFNFVFCFFFNFLISIVIQLTDTFILDCNVQNLKTFLLPQPCSQCLFPVWGVDLGTRLLLPVNFLLKIVTWETGYCEKDIAKVILTLLFWLFPNVFLGT